MRISRASRWGAGVGALTVLVVAVGLGFSSFVRARVLAESRKRGLNVTVGNVRPGWFAFRLRGVRGTLEGVEGLEADFDEATVGVSQWLAPREVVFSDGRI